MVRRKDRGGVPMPDVSPVLVAGAGLAEPAGVRDVVADHVGLFAGPRALRKASRE
jgi:hypothetical protein